MRDHTDPQAKEMDSNGIPVTQRCSDVLALPSPVVRDF